MMDGDARVDAPTRPEATFGFDDFYIATVRRTLALARSLTRSWADAEDLVQDAYADAHRRWERVGAMDDPSAWVRRAVLNRSASRWRRLGREVRALARTAARSHDHVDAAEPHDVAFWEAVATLPPQQARVVGLFYVEDMSVDQIAAELECSPGTVKTHLSRARASLQTSLSDSRELLEEAT